MIQTTFWTILHGVFFVPNSTRSNLVQACESPPFLLLRLSNSLVIPLLHRPPFQPLCYQQHLTYLHCLTECFLTLISNPCGNCTRHLLLTNLSSPSSTLFNCNLSLIQSHTLCGDKSCMLISRSSMHLWIEDIVTKTLQSPTDY